MMWPELINDIKETVVAGAAIVASVQAWRAHGKAKQIKTKSEAMEEQLAVIKTDVATILAQQQSQKQSQNITVNVGTTATGTGSAKTNVTLSDSPESE